MQGSAARTIEIWSDAPVVLTLEQLTVGADGAVAIVETRALTVAPDAAFSYKPDVNRYVRLRYEGVSPRTYSTSELSRLERIRAPDPLPGGELLIVVPAATVRPDAFDVAGPRTERVPVTQAPSVSMPGLPAGRYRVTPVYAGGVKGATRTALVDTATSRVVVASPEAVGAAEILADAGACGRATGVTIDLLVAAPAPPGGGAAAPPQRAPFLLLEPRCQLFAAGLSPGTYDVSYRAQEAVLGRASVTIGPQQVSQVIVPAATIAVSGRVTLNGAPIAHVTLVFRFQGSAQVPAGAVTTAQTDAAGHYTARVPARGRFSITLPPEGVLYSVHENATFDQATNAFDIALSGGIIAVFVDGWDGHRAVGIRIEGQRSQQYSRWTGRRRVFAALPFGQHVVTLLDGNQTPLESRTVIVTAARPEADVRFTLPPR